MNVIHYCGNWLMWFFGDSYLVCNTTRLLLCNERNQFWIILDHQDSHNRNRLQHQNQKIESPSLQQVHVTIQRPIDKQIIEWKMICHVKNQSRVYVGTATTNVVDTTGTQSVCWHYWYTFALRLCEFVHVCNTTDWVKPTDPISKQVWDLLSAKKYIFNLVVWLHVFFLIPFLSSRNRFGMHAF